MVQQYWIGEFYIDLSRNQISRDNQSISVPPKALQVLTQLAKHQGSVVSYEQLLDTVWPGSVVTPNTLHRCIAQLRKSMADKDKTSAIIKTHSKQGYSLERTVVWQASKEQEEDGETVKQTAQSQRTNSSDSPFSNNTASVNSVSSTSNLEQQQASTKATHPPYKLALAAGFIFIVLLIVANYRTPSESIAKFHDLRYITATDNKEHSASYSADGNYILFHRYQDVLCNNSIWAKNTVTQAEVQLTQHNKTYLDQSLSPDGKTLVFIEEQDCTQPISQNYCYELLSIDFQRALTTPQQPNVLLSCLHSKIKKPQWLDNENLILLQREKQTWRLVRFNINDKTTTSLYHFEQGNVFAFDYSSQHQQLAVTSFKNDGRQYIERLSINGQVISSSPITPSKGVPRHLKISPKFAPNTDKLIFSYASKLYSLSFSGEVSEQDFVTDENAGAPYFHPSGSKVLLIKGRYDSDIAALAIPAANDNAEQPRADNRVVPELALSVFERSITGEDFAKFHPDGNQIAYISAKTGTQQVWLLEQGVARVVSNFPKGTIINNLLWDNTGQSVLVLANSELYIMSLDGQYSVVDFPYAINQVFDWDSESQRLTANVLLDGMHKFVAIDLDTLDFQTINHRQVAWADINSHATTVYTDHLQQFWLSKNDAIEDQPIPALAGQGSRKRFLLKGDSLYGINRDDHIWYYNLDTQQFTLLAKIRQPVDYITDINQHQLLITTVVAAKKEVVEMSVSY